MMFTKGIIEFRLEALDKDSKRRARCLAYLLRDLWSEFMTVYERQNYARAREEETGCDDHRESRKEREA